MKEGFEELRVILNDYGCEYTERYHPAMHWVVTSFGKGFYIEEIVDDINANAEDYVAVIRCGYIVIIPCEFWQEFMVPIYK